MSPAPTRNPYKRCRLARPMRPAHWFWGAAFAAGGTAVLLTGAPDGPRIGIAMVLITLAALVVGLPLSTWILRKTTRPEDYEGSCPVGRLCPSCEAFNYNPRKVCRVCGHDLADARPATGERQTKEALYSEPESRRLHPRVHGIAGPARPWRDHLALRPRRATHPPLRSLL